MAKKKSSKILWSWIIIPFLAVSLLTIYSLWKSNKPTPSAGASSQYLVYQNPAYGFSVEYPGDWEIRSNTQVFENGDVVAFRKTGPAQKERTELTDGAQFAISKPFTINTDLETWVKNYFPSQAEFSEMPLKNHVFKNVYNCSNTGCMTYLYTLVDGQVYGVAIFAEGPDRDKMVYENSTLYMLKSLQFTNAQTGTITKEEAVAKIKALPEVIDYLDRVPEGIVAVNGEDDVSYMIQVYEIKDGHTATFNWYNVNKSTGAIEEQF